MSACAECGQEITPEIGPVKTWNGRTRCAVHHARLMVELGFPHLTGRRQRYYVLGSKGQMTPEDHREWKILHEEQAYLETTRPIEQSSCAHAECVPVNEDVARCLRCGDLMVI